MRINLGEGPRRGEEEEKDNVKDEGLDDLAMEMEELKPLKVVGRGAMGTVFLVRKEGCDKPLALKAISKSELEKKNDGWKRARMEREILRRLRHPFLPALLGHVETDQVVGWIVDYCSGGDLNALRRKQSDKTFSESIVRFYAAEIVLALEHLHSLGIVYRDLKSENVMVQSNGHIMLTDFDLSTRLRLSPGQTTAPADRRTQKQIHRTLSCSFAFVTSCVSSQQPNAARVSPIGKTSRKGTGGAVVTPSTSGMTRSNSFVGTEEYVSPEMLKGDGHDFAVDWWALGILLYEMLYGKTPFKGATRKETFYQILVRQPQFTRPWTPLRDLIMRLLDKEPRTRLGSANGAAEIKNHLFFRGLEWEALENVSRAPFVPPPVSFEDMPHLDSLDVKEYLDKQTDSKEKKQSNGCKDDKLAEKKPDRQETEAFKVF